MEQNKFKIGKYVVYGTNGVCLIEDIKTMKFADEEDTYFILKPMGEEMSRVYVPQGNTELMSKMRPIMDKEDVDSLLLRTKGKEIPWDNDRRNRIDAFHDILIEGVTQELLLMIRCIYKRKQELTSLGKKLPTTDENTLKAAEKMVEDEFSYALDIDKDDVYDYIERLLLS